MATDCHILFIGTDRSFEKEVLAERGFDHETIFVHPFKGKQIWKKLVALIVFPWSVCLAIGKIKRFNANLVVGVGGYSAAPVAVGAWLMGIRVVIHEQNMLPGMTNRLVAKLASRIYVSFKGTRMPGDPKKIRVFGNPVRREVVEATRLGRLDSDRKEASDLGIQTVDHSEQGEPFTVLVLGGSQGARFINRSVIEALEELGSTDNLHVIHQTGTADEEEVRSAYEKNKISGHVRAFFNDMGVQYTRADLLICRAGATTVAEAALLGKACIFIPYPFAANNHQEINARQLVKEGAAGMILERDLNGKKLARLIQYYYTHRQALSFMSDQVRAFSHPEAAKKIVKDCLQLMRQKHRLALFLLWIMGRRAREASIG